jgi:PDZ domain-containing secreted protein
MTISDLPASIPPLAPDVTTLRNQILAQKGQDTDTIEEEREEEEEGKAEKEITKQELDKEMIYMGIVTSDSTVVYYKLTKGIKKPADIPDE